MLHCLRPVYRGWSQISKDGMLWGLLPIFLITKGLRIDQIGTVVALYPIVWSVAQLMFGPFSDRIGRKIFIVPGMALQGVGVVGFVWLEAISLRLCWSVWEPQWFIRPFWLWFPIYQELLGVLLPWGSIAFGEIWDH